MKYTRSAKCYFSKWITESKLSVINEFIKEMNGTVEFAVENHEQSILEGEKKATLLLADNLSKCTTWLTARAKKNAYAEAHALVLGTQRSCDALKKKYSTPKHNPDRIMLSCTNVEIQRNPALENFDLLIELRCFDSRKKIKIAIPLKRHKTFNKWYKKGKLCSSVILTPEYIQFSFEMERAKKEKGNIIGIDPNAKHLLSDDEGNHYGSEMWSLLQKLRRKVKLSKAWWACREEIKEYIDRTCQTLPFWATKLLVLEDNRKIKNKSKLRGRLSRNIRSVLTGWSISRINDRIERLCEENGVSLRRVSAWFNSTTCPCCGHSEKANRVSQEEFVCRKCGHTDNADKIGATNSLARFALGTYGSEYKQTFMEKHSTYHA
ncbi:MAG TPA: transposase, partial [Candidatus Glassbacteria bacterium]|nr:transposase [Candidatus Glassbacteria bacterium]